MNIAISYFSYLAISIALTVWVAKTLHKNGRIFLVEAFHGNEELADSVNHLLVVGFYLVNAGYIALALRTPYAMDTLRAVIELESAKIGGVLLILAGGVRPVPTSRRSLRRDLQLGLGEDRGGRWCCGRGNRCRQDGTPEGSGRVSTLGKVTALDISIPGSPSQPHP